MNPLTKIFQIKNADEGYLVVRVFVFSLLSTHRSMTESTARKLVHVIHNLL
jgi:hypothetical protein